MEEEPSKNQKPCSKTCSKWEVRAWTVKRRTETQTKETKQEVRRTEQKSCLMALHHMGEARRDIGAVERNEKLMWDDRRWNEKIPLVWPNDEMDQDAGCRNDRRCVGWWWCLLCGLEVFVLSVVGYFDLKICGVCLLCRGPGRRVLMSPVLCSSFVLEMVGSAKRWRTGLVEGRQIIRRSKILEAKHFSLLSCCGVCGGVM